MTTKVRPRGADAFAERVDTFTAAVQASEARATRLLGPSASLSQDPAALREALEELRVQHEELLVAEEELRAQVDELHRLSVAVDHERERFADVFELSPDACLVTDRSGVIRDANAAARELVGVSARYLRGKPFSALLDPASIKAFHDALDRIAEGRAALDLVVRPRAGGEVRVAAHVALGARGDRALLSLRPRQEPTEADALADTARARRDQNELLVRERRLRADLERTTQAKDRFIAVLAHDLRAPLNAILGWSQLLRREHLDRQARSRALETIERNARTQARLIEELLDLSRMAAERLELSVGPVDVGALAARVVEGLTPDARDRGLELTSRHEEGLVVVGDRDRLEQVLTNLVANAMKFTPAGGHVTVEASRDGREARLVVDDDGKGIEPGLLPHVFELYTQEHRYDASRSGLGLGLYIVKQLVGLHGGRVSAASDGAGAGAKFTVFLPLTSAAPRESDPALPAATATLADLRVLVVDDEPDARDLVATILRRAGAEVAVASGAQQALDVQAGWAPDVIVSDLAMSGGDGLELIGLLRQREPTIGAIAVSGFAAEEDVERALAAGFDVHVGKPVGAADLVSAVREAARLRSR